MNFNNKSIITCADTIITCVGTSGLEFSCYGIPAILEGQNHYTGYGICDEPSSIQEYRELLNNLEAKPL